MNENIEVVLISHMQIISVFIECFFFYQFEKKKEVQMAFRACNVYRVPIKYIRLIHLINVEKFIKSSEKREEMKRLDRERNQF